MMGLLGRKLGMTQIFDEQGNAIPVTVLEVGPCDIVQIKTVERDGYNALQLGFDEKPEKKAKRPELGHFKRAGVAPKRFVKEVRVEDVSSFQVGQTLKVNDVFQVGDFVDVTGKSKGKGFAGVMKRWGFHGAPDSHGPSLVHRRPGSIGASSFPSRVIKGKKMPGHAGFKTVTVQNLQVVGIDEEKNLLLVKGAVAGPAGGYVVVKKAVKKYAQAEG